MGGRERERKREVRERRERNWKEVMRAPKLHKIQYNNIQPPTLSPLKIFPYLAMQMWLERSRERFLVR